MKVYAPRPGSITERAVAHLREFGGALSTSALADAIDVETSGFPAVLEYAVRNGVVRCEKRDGLNWWSIGDGVPPEREKDEPLRHYSKSVDTPSVEADPIDFDPIVKTSRATTFPRLVQPEDVPARDFVVGLFSDGVLVIRRGAESMTLDAAESRELCAFLDRVLAS